MKAAKKVKAFTGLRGLAFLGVMAYHLYPNKVTGGYLGVVIFFVLSGYLLMRQFILGYKEEDLGALGGRYKKLTRPLAIMVLLMGLASLALFRPKLGNLGLSGISALLGYNNWYQLSQSLSYFDLHGAYRPFTHLWSLSVEWQFYIIWSLLLLKKGSRKQKYLRLMRWTLIMTLLSLVSMVLLRALVEDPTRAYYGTESRFFSFGIGVLAGGIGTYGLRRASFKDKGGPISLLMVVMVLSFIFFKEGAFLYYGGMFIFSLAMGLLLIYLSKEDNFWARILANPFLMYVGTRSYPLYLWQYSLMIVFRELFAHSSLAYGVQVLIQIILLLILSEITHQVASNKKLKQGGILVSALALMVLALVGSWVFPQVGGAKAFEDPDRRQELEEVAKKPGPKETKEKDPAQPQKDRDLLSDLSEEDKKALGQVEGLFLGDSITEEAAPIFQELFKSMTVDGKINRQMIQAYDLVQAHEEDLPVLVIQLGINGPFAKKDLEKIIDSRPESQVFLVNTVMPDPWEGEVNQTMAEVAQAYDRVHLIDWYGITKSQEVYFYPDHTHPNLEGQHFMAQLVGNKILEVLGQE
ncbi:MAG: acyltransferase family protein [Tissierellia bacterium]|nr:acyltransferase family protein [Tissierellia bacterium]